MLQHNLGHIYWHVLTYRTWNMPLKWELRGRLNYLKHQRLTTMIFRCIFYECRNICYKGRYMLFYRHGNETKFQRSYFIISTLNSKFIFPHIINTHLCYILNENPTRNDKWYKKYNDFNLFHFHVASHLHVASLVGIQAVFGILDIWQKKKFIHMEKE